VFSHGYRGITPDYRIGLRCQRKNCNINTYIKNIELLKNFIVETNANPKFPYDFLNKTDPRIFDLHGYDLETFKLSSEHKCEGTDFEIYNKSLLPVSLPVPEPTSIQLLKIEKYRESPTFHFKINGQMYFYGFRGVKVDFKIVLRCKKMHENCYLLSHVSPTEQLKEIIFERPRFQLKNARNKNYELKYFDKTDPRVYDTNSYDFSSFEFFGDHKCRGISMENYLDPNFRNIFTKNIRFRKNKSLEMSENLKKYKSQENSEPPVSPRYTQEFDPEKHDQKLIDEIFEIPTLLSITNYKRKFYKNFHTGNFKVQIKQKIYTYTCKGVKCNFTFYLCCMAKNCNGKATLTPKPNIFDNLVSRTDPKLRTIRYRFTDPGEPAVSNVENYYLESVKIIINHTCDGIEITNQSHLDESHLDESIEILVKTEVI
jgi:hypothetical protein